MFLGRHGLCFTVYFGSYTFGMVFNEVLRSFSCSGTFDPVNVF